MSGAAVDRTVVIRGPAGDVFVIPESRFDTLPVQGDRTYADLGYEKLSYENGEALATDRRAAARVATSENAAGATSMNGGVLVESAPDRAVATHDSDDVDNAPVGTAGAGGAIGDAPAVVVPDDPGDDPAAPDAPTDGRSGDDPVDADGNVPEAPAAPDEPASTARSSSRKRTR